jgi:hypothetical protein
MYHELLVNTKTQGEFIMPQQPAGMTNTNGVILSVGLFVNSEPWQMVMPLVTDATSLDAATLCKDAAQSFEASIFADILPIISSDGYIAFVSAEGMTNGAIPWRDTYASTANPGTGAAGAIPTNACALGVIYEDPEDSTLGARIRLAKTFISGISHTDVIGNTITPDLATRINNFLLDLQAGFASIADVSSSWYRVLNVPQPRTNGAPVVRLLQPEARGGIYTQKRRLVPRP